MRYDSTDVCLERVLFKSSVYMGNGLVTICVCLVDAISFLIDAASTWGEPC